jgi:uncharacterized RDD family membrane protein YckC
VFNVLHHGLADPPTLLSKALTLRGDIRPQAVAARGHVLWIVYPDGEVQTITAERSVLQDSWYYSTRVEPSLPRGVSVRAMAVTTSGPWVLVRVEDIATLENLESADVAMHTTEGVADARRRRNIAMGLPPRYGEEQTEETAPERENNQAEQAQDSEPAIQTEADDPSAPQSLPVDRLLQLDQGSWRVHPLPGDWSDGAQAWLVTEQDDAASPTLVGRASDRAAPRHATFDVYHFQNRDSSHWTHEAYELEASRDSAGLAFVSVESQLVAARFQFDAGLLLADLAVLRGEKALPVGRMTLRDISPNQWAMLGTGNGAALVSVPQDADQDETSAAARPSLVWTRLDIRGNTLLEPTVLALKQRSPMDDLMQYVMLAFIAVLATVLMLAFWRRDASWNKLELPANLMVADLGRRALAAAIDMAPGLLGSMYYFGLNFEELMLRWPGNGLAHTLEQIMPGTVVIGVFVIHTTVSELIFARTLGKVVTGLRTTALNGSRPRVWQLLIRGLLKILDMIPGAWLLLMLPVIAPHRQRLGDLVGRTVVVCEAPAADENQQDESGGDEED